MVVDAILDGLRREHQRQHRKIRGSSTSHRGRKGTPQMAPDGNGSLSTRRRSSASSFNLDIPLTAQRSDQPLHRLASNHLLTLSPPSKEQQLSNEYAEGMRVASPEHVVEGHTPTFSEVFAKDGSGKTGAHPGPDHGET